MKFTRRGLLKLTVAAPIVATVGVPPVPPSVSVAGMTATAFLAEQQVMSLAIGKILAAQEAEYDRLFRSFDTRVSVR